MASAGSITINYFSSPRMWGSFASAVFVIPYIFEQEQEVGYLYKVSNSRYLIEQEESLSCVALCYYQHQQCQQVVSPASCSLFFSFLPTQRQKKNYNLAGETSQQVSFV